VAYNIQTRNNKINVTHKVLFGSAVLGASVFGRKYVIPQNAAWFILVGIC
jgi:hypothetical protein